MSNQTSQFKIRTVRDSIIKEGQRTKPASRVEPYSIPQLKRNQYTGKRVLDVLLGVFGLMIFLFSYPIIAIAIKLSSTGSVIFKQKRTGFNGHHFTCYKFRTMHKIARKRSNDEPDITEVGDSRIFLIGKILRKTNLDELPQILNVIKGEMSLIGPRPYPVEECKYWNNTFDDFYYRYMVKPGVTGYAQVTGYRGGTLEVDHMRKRLDKDLIYVQKHTLTFDLKILYLTLKQMLTFRTNAH